MFHMYSSSSVIFAYFVVVFYCFFFFFFFFQAEDGIRDRNVTGVQTCALPICCGQKWCQISTTAALRCGPDRGPCRSTRCAMHFRNRPVRHWPVRPRSRRSEERRVGKEWRSWRGAVQGKEKSERDSVEL